MTKREYVTQVAVASSAMRRGMLRTSLTASVPLFGLVILMLYFTFNYPALLMWFFAIALPLCLIVEGVCWANVGRAFRSNSPACSFCGRHVGILQVRRVLKSGNCGYCENRIFEE